MMPENKMTDNDILNQIVSEASEVSEKNEDISKLRELLDKEYSDRDISELTPEDALEIRKDGLVVAEREFDTDASGKPNFIKEHSPDRVPKSADLSIFDSSEADLEEVREETLRKNIGIVGKNHNISDEDVMALLDIMIAYRKDKSINVYNRMPFNLQKQVRDLCIANGAPMTYCNQIAKMMIEEMISETEVDQTFIDFEKSLETAMKIPSLVDLYEEHMEDQINVKLPIMADAIENEDPEKARMLREVSDRFTWARTLEFAKKAFDENSRLRKLMRRDHSKYMRFAEELNFANRNTRFRMPDVTLIYPTLVKVINADEDNDITEEEIQKFVTLIIKSCDNLNKEDTVDASYIYYLFKNISMLSYAKTREESAADAFSVELISNIKALIYYIRAKEAAFNANNQPTKRNK